MQAKAEGVIRRCCTIIVLLQQDQHTYAELRQALNQCDKQTRRDVDWLREAGVPIDVEKTSKRFDKLSIEKKWKPATWLWQYMTAHD